MRRLGWDDKVPDDLEGRAKEILREMVLATEVEFPRALMEEGAEPEHPAQAREALSIPASRTVESAPVGGFHGFSGLMRLISSSEQRASSSDTGWSVATLTANL